MTGSSKRTWGLELAAMLLLLLAVLALLLHRAFLPDHTLFSNDGPLGRLVSQCHELPGRFTGCWADLNGIGFNTGVSIPDISLGLQYLLKPIWFSKFYALLAQVILGMGAWCFFYQLRFSRLACRLGGLAAALNSCFFSVSCWGVAAQSIAAGMMFFALAALADTTSWLRWWRVVLAGMAVGMAVTEASDVGAIFSLYVAAFVIFQAWLGEGPAGKKLATGFGRLIVVVLCAVFIASQAVITLVGTSVNGVEGTLQDTHEARWDWATQWSLPVRETAGLLVPGVFGYRMDTPGGGAYWGEIGRDPAVEKFIENGAQGAQPPGFVRYSGGGFYAGVLVVMLGIWALTQSLRPKESIYNLAQRWWLRFWLGVAIISLLLAYGRYAPFYQCIYALPYFSTIRNPIKFIYLVSFALIVIFGYGVDGLWRRHMAPVAPETTPRKAAPKGAWKTANTFEKFWLRGCWLVLGISLFAWEQYGSDQQVLADYLATVGFNPPDTEIMAGFSVWQVGWFVLFFVLAAGLMTALLKGAFAGGRAKWGGLALGLVLLADLGRANLPWVVDWNYQEKYASNPVVDRLRAQPYAHRITILPDPALQTAPYLNQLYRLEWLPQQFSYYNIQTLDVVEMPRMPIDLAAYVGALGKMPGNVKYQALIRMWELTGTDYVFGPADALDDLNQQMAGEPFHISERFDIVPKAGKTGFDNLENLTTVPEDNGPYALFEFTRALPRAQLFSQWQITTNDQTVLDQLASPAFDASQKVLVSDELPAGAAASGVNRETVKIEGKADAGKVEYASYAPKDIVLKCNALSPAVLLLNDHYEANWKVLVDGRPDRLLRCNFIMRGVWLPAGAHTVEFRFQPPYGMLYFTLTALGVALLVLVVVLAAGVRMSGRI